MALHDITYALKDGKPVHVSEVERGLSCGCTCAACGEPLVARKGKVKAHHFAHKSDGHSCGYGYQSSLHLMAKEAVAEMGYIWLPDLYINVGNGEGNQILLEEARSVTVDEVWLERKVGGVIPDIVIRFGDEQFLLEVYVTHAVDDTKKRKLEAAGLSAMELDLHDVDGDVDKAYIQDLMMSHTDEKYWACGPWMAEWKERYRDAADIRGITHGEDGDSVYGCPKTYDRKYGVNRAKVTRCAACRFCMGRTDDEVYCFGRDEVPYPQEIHQGIRKEAFPAADEGRLREEWERKTAGLVTRPSYAVRQEEPFQSMFSAKWNATGPRYSADLSGLAQAMEDALAFKMLQEKMGVSSRQSLLNMWRRANNEWHVKTDSHMPYGFQSFLASLVVELFPEQSCLYVTTGEHAMLQAGIDFGSGERIVRFFVDGEEPYPVPEGLNLYDIGQDIRWESVTLDRFKSIISGLE